MTTETETEGRYESLTEEEIATLFEHGASPEFVQMAQYDDGGRNSVRENANRVIEGYVGEEVTELTFGDFGKAMWDGDMYNAMRRADGRNTTILLELFGLDYINAKSRQQHDKPGYKKKDGRVVYK